MKPAYIVPPAPPPTWFGVRLPTGDNEHIELIGLTKAAAEEIVKRWNAYDKLVSALHEIIAKVGDDRGMGNFGGAYLHAIRDVLALVE